MTALEDRLRKDLPELADWLTAEASPPLGITASRLPESPQPTSKPRRVWFAAAAAAIVVAAAVGVAAVARHQVDDPPAVATDPYGSWTVIAQAPIKPRSYPVTAWTGSEAVFWAGSSLSRNTAMVDGAAYDPESDTWRAIATPGCGHPGLVSAYDGKYLYALAKEGGGKFNMAAGTWSDLPQVDGMFFTGAVLANDALWGIGPTIVAVGATPELSIARYDGDHWEKGPVSKEGLAGADPWNRPVLWTGNEIVVWDRAGGGPAFNPSTQTWTQLAAPVPPAGRITLTTATMTDAGLVSVNEIDDNGKTHTAVATLVDGTWKWTDATLPALDLDKVTVAPAGDWLMLFRPDDGPLMMHLPSGNWAVQEDGPLAGLQAPSAVWTGTQLVIWGGVSNATARVQKPVEGAVWTPPRAVPKKSQPEPPAASENCPPPVTEFNGGLVGAPVGEVLPGGLLPGATVGPLKSVAVNSPELETEWSAVSGMVRNVDGSSVGLGIWLVPDPIVAYGGGLPGGDDAIARWRAEPWKYPESTHLYAANDVARNMSVWRTTPVAERIDVAALVAPCYR
jgi:hypothetical protein